MKRIHKVLAFSLLLQGSLFAISPANATSGFSGFSSGLTYVTDSPSVKVFPNVSLTSSTPNYALGSVTYSVDTQSATDVLSFETSTSAITTTDSISVVGTTIFKGTGSGANPIGNIDGVLNGSGSDLKVNFDNTFTNGNFSDSTSTTVGDEVRLSGWTAYKQRVFLGGVSSIGGWPTPTDGSMPATVDGTTNNDSAPISGTQNYTVNNRAADRTGAAGSYSVNLATNGSCQSPYGYCIVRGPYIVSNSAIYLRSGDSVSFYWEASGGGDAYDVYGYLLNVANGNTIQLLNSTGATGGATSPWGQVTKNITAGQDGSYKFVFIVGTWDASGGRVQGANLYIDDVAVSTTAANVTPADIQELSRLVQYRSSSTTPDLTKTFAIETSASDASDGVSSMNVIRKLVLKARSQVKGIGDADQNLSSFIITRGALHSGDSVTVSSSRTAGETAGTYTNTLLNAVFDPPSSASRYQVEFLDGGLLIGISLGDTTFNSIEVRARSSRLVSDVLESESRLRVVGYPDTEIVRVLVSADTGTVNVVSATNVTSATGYQSPVTAADSQIALVGAVSDINAALATLKYNAGTQEGSDTLRLTVSYVGSNSGVAFNPTNSHYYQYVSTAVTWQAAYDAIESQTVTGVCNYVFNGLCGYFATATNASENTFITEKVGTASAWLAGTDKDLEGTWKWVGGSPESGTVFFTAPSTVNTYASWNGGEPNDAGGNEDALQILSGGTGLWNDLPHTSSTMGYVVEYSSGTGTLQYSPASRNVSITVLPYAGLESRNLNWVTSAQTVNYGDSITVSASPSAGSGTVTYSLSGSSCTLSAARLSVVSGSGTCSITATVASDGVYDEATSTALTITAGKRPIVITADSIGKVYGTTDPALTARITGGTLASGDAATVTAFRSAGETIGLHITYPVITFTTGNVNNYALTSETGLFAIVQSAGVAPTFDVPTKQTNGFTVRVTNYSPSNTYKASVDKGSVTMGTPSGSRVEFTVTGIGTSSAVLTVTSSSPTTFDASSSVTGFPKGDQVVTLSISKYDGARAGQPIFLDDAATSNVPRHSVGAGIFISSQTPFVCSVNGNVLALIRAGLCTLVAEGVATADWNASPRVSASITVGSLAPAPRPGETTTVSTVGTGNVIEFDSSAVGSYDVTRLGFGVTGTTNQPGKIGVNTDPTFSGKTGIDITYFINGETIVVTIPVIIPPAPPKSSGSAPQSKDKSTIKWDASPNAKSYQVYVRDKLECTVTTTSCEVPFLVGPATPVRVVVIGGDDTKTEIKPQFALTGQVPVLTANFATGSSKLNAAIRKELIEAAEIIKREGFKSLVVYGHTDSRGSNNEKLSRERAAAVRDFLKNLLPGVKFQIAGFGATQKLANENTKKGLAANRRAELKIAG